MAPDNPLRALPAVDEALRAAPVEALLARHPRAHVVAEVRAAIDRARSKIQGGDGAGASSIDAIATDARAALEAAERPHVVRAINATGVILHTGLGRAPLAAEARAAIADVAAGYSTLEIDRESGERGVREAGVERLLRALVGAEAATVVNN